MLSFLSPLFLVGAAAAALPIVLHLLKRQPEARVKFAAVKLLKRAPVEHTQKRHLRAAASCWRFASPRCCCWRWRSRARSSPPARRWATPASPSWRSTRR